MPGQISNTSKRFSVTKPIKIKHLMVTTPQGPSGDLIKEARFAFNYAAKQTEREVSLTMPLRAESYASGALLPIFEMNRPEGYLLSKIEEAFAKEGGLDDMRLLDIVGGAQIGRLTYARPEEQRPRVPGRIGLKEILARQPTSELFDFLVATYFQSGISGVQPKVLVPDDDKHDAGLGRETVHADLIVKAGGDEFPYLTQNEFMCLTAARRAGIATPNFWLSEDGGLFVTERFDLRGGAALGFEDMTVLMNKGSRRKYEGSYENVARAVRLFLAEADPLAALHELFEYIAFIVMVRNGDGHLKNFGLLYEHPSHEESIRLAPLYDVVTTSIYGFTHPRTSITKYDRTLALNLRKSREYPDRDSLFAFGREHCGVHAPERVIDRIAEALSATLKDQREKIPAKLWDNLNKEWQVGL
jgi:serine/threonine-protein kinase HipA